MQVYDVYGSKNLTLEQAKEFVENSLKISFDLHESSYVGGNYFRAVQGEEEFLLQLNYNEIENEWMEPTHQEYAILLYASELQNPEKIEMALSTENQQIKLLRRELV